MSILEQFLWAVLGSILPQLVVLDRHFLRRPELPRRFRSRTYLLIRSALAVASGLLAVAFDPTAPLQAIYIGVTAPLLVQGMLDRASLPVRSGQ